MAMEDKTGILLKSGTNELEIIEIYIDEEGGYRGYYGVNVAKVLEIISMPAHITKPPNAAEFVTGVFDHRGKVIMLLDLAHWLGRKQLEGGKRIVIITEFNKVTSAFLVSGVTRIHRTSWANIKSVDNYMQNFCDAITGMILMENRTVLMLDLERAMGALDPRLAVPYRDPDEKMESLSNVNISGLSLPLKVLHADDSRMIRRSVKQLLESDEEFIVTSMVDGKEAWEYLVELKKKASDQNKRVTDFIDIVLSDIEMPGMDGYSFCQKVKNDPALSALPFVLFSSLITDKLRHKGEFVGADAQLAKPSPAELVHDLKEILSQRLKI
jgi:two-component system, chemotaxis family, chemotaxis protein CheV